MAAAGFADIFEKHAGPLRLWARQWLEPAAAEDAVQEAFVRLLGQRHRPDDPAAWLFAVTRRIAIDQQRRQRTRREALPKLAPADFAEADPLEIAETLDAVSALSERQREVVIARHWGGLGFAAIAELCGTSLATAHADHTAAMNTLRERFDA
ncbi:MAG: sigma-70 family RNA polymerase sigma factor [Planctomycetota bacterium]